MTVLVCVVGPVEVTVLVWVVGSVEVTVLVCVVGAVEVTVLVWVVGPVEVTVLVWVVGGIVLEVVAVLGEVVSASDELVDCDVTGLVVVSEVANAILLSSRSVEKWKVKRCKNSR